MNHAFSFTYRDAGHLLGAASADVTVREDGRETRVLFSGDVGRFDAVLTKDPELAPDADYLVVESTYGNRTHPALSVLDQLEGVLKKTFARGGVLLIPAFAVGRAQQMIFLMDQLVTRGPDAAPSRSTSTARWRSTPPASTPPTPRRIEGEPQQHRRAAASSTASGSTSTARARSRRPSTR